MKTLYTRAELAAPKGDSLLTKWGWWRRFSPIDGTEISCDPEPRPPGVTRRDPVGEPPSCPHDHPRVCVFCHTYAKGDFCIYCGRATAPEILDNGRLALSIYRPAAQKWSPPTPVSRPSPSFRRRGSRRTPPHKR